jgi:hypothetical protein
MISFTDGYMTLGEKVKDLEKRLTKQTARAEKYKKASENLRFKVANNPDAERVIAAVKLIAAGESIATISRDLKLSLAAVRQLKNMTVVSGQKKAANT